ncbi:DUF4113 domain-containing protein [Vagococcus sp. WN89Y]|uniref:DUF4113 domain-containing protein n=1 Tax=Vagococcus sp. WN89Y TaxID=3457258 RepID=UPI003FCEBF95
MSYCRDASLCPRNNLRVIRSIRFSLYAYGYSWHSPAASNWIASEWQMKHEILSLAYTTRWSNLSHTTIR